MSFRYGSFLEAMSHIVLNEFVSLSVFFFFLEFSEEEQKVNKLQSTPRPYQWAGMVANANP